MTTTIVADAAGACHGVRVIPSADLSADWSDAARELAAQMPAPRENECAAMTLILDPAEAGSARLSATAPDGRHTERVVERPATLGSTALGLVAALPPDEPEPAPVVRPAPSTPSVTTKPVIAPTNAAPPTKLPEVWLSGALGARIAEPSAVGLLDLEGRGDLEVSKWLLVVSFRYGSSIGEQLTPRDASYEETAVGLGIGRTIHAGPTALELVLEPSFAAVAIDDNDDSNGSNASRSQLRIGGSARWSIPLDAWWRLTITADSEISPRNLIHEIHVDPNLPPLPAWTGGLQIGAAGKLL